MNLSHKDLYYQAQRRRDFERQAEQYRMDREIARQNNRVTSKSPLYKVFLLVMSIIPGFIR